MKLQPIYTQIMNFVDLHLYDSRRNHDKVYHLAVLERQDGKYDAVYRYGRRGKGLCDGILSGGYSNHSQATSAIVGKENEQVRQGYQYSPGITPGVWDNIILKAPEKRLPLEERLNHISSQKWSETPWGKWKDDIHGDKVLQIVMADPDGNRWTVAVYTDGTLAHQAEGKIPGIPEGVVKHYKAGDVKSGVGLARTMADIMEGDGFSIIDEFLRQAPAVTNATLFVSDGVGDDSPDVWFW